MPNKLRDPDILPRVVAAICSGATNAEAAAEVGIHSKTIQRQKKVTWFAGIYGMADTIRRHRRRGEEPPEDLRQKLDAAVEVAIPVKEASDRVVIIPDIVGPRPPSVQCEPLSGAALEVASTAIAEVEAHLPTGRVNKGVSWELGVRPILAKAQEMVDDPNLPVRLRVEAWRTLNKMYIDLTLLRISTGRSMLPPPPEPTLPRDFARDTTGARGIPPEVTDRLMDMVAGPVPEDPGGEPADPAQCA